MIADVALIAAMAAVLAAGIAGWLGGRPTAITLAIAMALMFVNLVMAWNFDDPPGTTIEGMSAAVGMMISVALFALALVFAFASRAARWLLRA